VVLKMISLYPFVPGDIFVGRLNVNFNDRSVDDGDSPPSSMDVACPLIAD
jgi:hypothetical protein